MKEAILLRALIFIILLVNIASFTVIKTSRTSTRIQQQQQHRSTSLTRTCRLSLAFYSDDEDDDEDEDEDDDDDDDEDDLEENVDMDGYRNRLSTLFGGDNTPAVNKDQTDVSSVDELISFARSSEQAAASNDWALPADPISQGVVLLANPAQFCRDWAGGLTTPSPRLLAKFGLTLPPPADLGPDRQADLLPVLIIVEMDNREARAVLLNRRTGYLLGDLENPDGNPPMGLEKFCIQPLWFGGVDNFSSGLDVSSTVQTKMRNRIACCCQKKS
jgi:hypothetical protein